MTKPPDSLSPEAEQDAFYRALGKAITQWQRVEEVIAVIFSTAVNDRKAEPSVVANAAFHAAINFNTKLAMTTTALEMRSFLGVFTRVPSTGDPMLADWSPLANRCHRRAARRNELAHFALSYDDRRKPGYRFHLRPNVVDMRAALIHGGHPPERNVCSITAQGNSFQKLGIDLVSFFVKWFLDNSKEQIPELLARSLYQKRFDADKG